MSVVTAEERQYQTGYELGTFDVSIVHPSFYLGSGPLNFYEGIWSTFFSNPSRIQCCANESDDGPGLSALGYWAPVGYGATVEGAQGNGAESPDEGSYNYDLDLPILTNFTVTWVIGKPFPDKWVAAGDDNSTLQSHYLWSEIPEVVSLNCEPIIEASNATLTVTREDEMVGGFNLLDPPTVHQPAWSDYYLDHKSSGEVAPTLNSPTKKNITVR